MIEREGGHVENRTDHIEMVLQVDPLTNLGIQVGYAIDAPDAADGNDPEGRIHWLRPVWEGTGVRIEAVKTPPDEHACERAADCGGA